MKQKGEKRVNMCNCKDNAEIVMVYGSIKTYRCTKCGKEWEEKDVYDLQKE